MCACLHVRVSSDVIQISFIHHNNGVLIFLVQVVNDDGAVSYLLVLSIRCRARTGDHGLTQIKGEIAHPM